MKDQIEKFKQLNEQLKALDEKKIRLEEQYKSKKEALTKLVKEIKDAGYDPNNLKEIIQTKEKELVSAIADFESQITDISKKLSAIEV